MTLASPSETQATPPEDVGGRVEALGRGARGRCPRCGEGALFHGWLTVAPACDSCGLRFDGHRADDLPAYLSILLSGKVSITALAALSTTALSVGAITAAAIALALSIALLSLRPIKGAVVALQWIWRMHGFADPEKPRSAGDGAAEGA